MTNQTNEKKAKLLHKLLIIFNIILVFGLFLSYLSTIINPQKFNVFSIFGLAYPAILALNIVIIVIWFFVDKKLIFISLISILIGWRFLTTNFQLNFPTKDEDLNSFKILSYNVRMFDKYNWIEDDSTTLNILKFIEKQSADIICIQEFYSNENDEIDIKTYLKNLDKSKSSHIIFASEGNTIYKYGFATFSNFPIINKGLIKYQDDKEISIFSDINISNDTIRVYNCHLESVHLAYEDYHFIDSIGVSENNENKLKRFGSIISKLLDAYKTRSEQAEIILNHIATSPFPVVVCGDFNDTPVSYVYHKIRKDLEDAFVESGKGFGSSFVYSFFRLRIDYILHDESLESANFKTHKINLSDHFPVSCDITVSN